MPGDGSELSPGDHESEDTPDGPALEGGGRDLSGERRQPYQRLRSGRVRVNANYNIKGNIVVTESRCIRRSVQSCGVLPSEGASFAPGLIQESHHGSRVTLAIVKRPLADLVLLAGV